jgi:hypothetical protein
MTAPKDPPLSRGDDDNLTAEAHEWKSRLRRVLESTR